MLGKDMSVGEGRRIVLALAIAALLTVVGGVVGASVGWQEGIAKGKGLPPSRWAWGFVWRVGLGGLTGAAGGLAIGLPIVATYGN